MRQFAAVVAVGVGIELDIRGGTDDVGTVVRVDRVAETVNAGDFQLRRYDVGNVLL